MDKLNYRQQVATIDHFLHDTMFFSEETALAHKYNYLGFNLVNYYYQIRYKYEDIHYSFDV